MLLGIETAAVRSWPALETAGIHGWLWRYTSGGSLRANSVAALAFTGSDPEATISRVEQLYRAKYAPSRLTVSDVSAPADLDALLARLGYERGDDHVTLAKGLGVTAEPLPPDVELATGPTPDWLQVYLAGLNPNRQAVAPRILAGLPPQLRDPIATAPGAGNPNRNDPLAGMNDPNELRGQMGAMSDLSLRLREVWDAANRNNVALYAVDPRGLPTSEFDLSQPSIAGSIDRQYLNASVESLRLLSEQTDGKAFVGRNDLSTGINSIVRDTSAYYLLGYNSTQAPSDGKFHEIKVQLRRPGVQIRARKGYWALTADEVAKATGPVRPEVPKAVETALGAISRPALSRSPIRTWVGTSRGENGKTRVTFVWEPVARVAGDRDARDETPARVMLTAVAPDGSPSFRGRVPETALAPAGPAAGIGRAASRSSARR